MPLYTYRCNKCCHEFELLLPMHTDSADIECAACGQKGVERVFSSFSFGVGKSCSSGSCGGCSGCS
ncbi:MAG: zinc ribbon domain-containing protein [Dehalococcoidaceae bacterium]|nr:zinc ribbon domain-containing protein [Dehalococcoidaceae bacterium]